MNKLFQSEKYLNYLKRRARKERKAKLRYELYIKAKNILKYKKTIPTFRHLRDWPVNIEAPEIFSLIKNSEETISFINKIGENFRKRNKVFILLNKVEEIDYDAIAVLLSVMILFRTSHIPFNGDRPVAELAKNKLDDSGFFDELYKKDRRGMSYVIGKDKQIFSSSEKKVEPSLGLPVMKYASEFIWEEKRICKGLQRVLLELMHNTHNHAGGYLSRGMERWCFFINHNKDKKVVEFVFVDYGVGIFNSLNKKEKGNKWYDWQNKLKSVSGLPIKMTNEEILKKLLNGEMHVTVTGEDFRGKGLPGIKQVLDRNQISNLCIISNNTYAEVSNNKYKLLRQDFSGTFIYWELCYSNKNHPWTIKL